MDKRVLIKVLKDEIEKSTGCTDPGAVSLAVSRATKELSGTPDKIKVTVSPNIYKNGISVGIPGTGKRGLHLAAALGAVIDESDKGLGILDYVDGDKIAEALNLMQKSCVEITYGVTPDPLYIKAEVTEGRNTAYTIIANDYSNIIEVAKNDNITFSNSSNKADEVVDILRVHGLQQLFRLIDTMELEELSFLLEAAKVNKRAAESGFSDSSMKLGRALKKQSGSFPPPLSAMLKGQALTAAAGEARMLGLKVPIMAIAGSGNHGITNFLGVLAVAEELGCSQEHLAKALAISSTVTVYIKGYIKRMTAFCGCSVAAATGVAAGVVYLLDGSYEDMVHAMQSVIGTLSGMLCDGAKETCAYKLSSATMLAIQFAHLAMEGVNVPSAVGIVGNSIEETFENMGLLNNPGMVATDEFLLKLIENIQSVKVK